MQIVTTKKLESLFHKIAKTSPSAYGEFEFKGIRIIIKKPRLLLGRERSKRLYDSRRAQGLCVHCGVKVKNRNSLSGKLYRLCEIHRVEELGRKKYLRQKK
jgi:hypothetical protein